jgi:XapX domain-containing protein
MVEMHVYLLSLGAGLLVGIVYSLLNISPPRGASGATPHIFGLLPGCHARAMESKIDAVSETRT